MALSFRNVKVLELLSRFVRERVPRKFNNYVELSAQLPYWTLLENLIQHDAWPNYDVMLNINAISASRRRSTINSNA